MEIGKGKARMKAMNRSQKPPYLRTIFVCCNQRDPKEAACALRGSEELRDLLKKAVEERGLKGVIRVSKAMCLGLCSAGPNICVFPENAWYTHVSKADLPVLITQWIDPLRNPSSLQETA